MLTKEQIKAFNKFKRLKVGALFMKQGTGKTRVALELIKTTNCDLVLFFCPFSTKANLKAEIDKWTIDRDYLIIGYETLSSSDKTYLELLEKVKDKKLFIVADESIFIKNENSKRFKRLDEIANHSSYRLILNGTPITKNEWDLYNQMYFLSPKIIDMSRHEFLNTFFKRITYKKKGHRENTIYKLSEVNVEHLHKLIKKYVFECDFTFDKKVNTNNILITSSVDTFSEYTEAKDKFLELLEKGMLGVENFVKLAVTCFKDKERHFKIAEHLKDKGQVIVFCTLLTEVDNISSKLDCYKITGDTPAKDRQEILSKFEKDNKPLLMTIGTGAFGLNLQFCHKLAFASITFDYAKIDQAISRIKRIGQEKDIEYTYYTSDLGIYNMILENIKNKKELKDIMIDFIEKGREEVEKIL